MFKVWEQGAELTATLESSSARQVQACANGPFSFPVVHSAQPAVQENGDDAGEGREGDPGSPRRCDIIIISGRKEKCEAAKEALEVCPALSPPWGEAWPAGRCPSGWQQRSGSSQSLSSSPRSIRPTGLGVVERT